ncbi:MAG: hypothetical protein ACKO9H_20910, partial [Planctomycetota bacterium]
EEDRVIHRRHSNRCIAVPGRSIVSRGVPSGHPQRQTVARKIIERTTIGMIFALTLELISGSPLHWILSAV